MLALVVGLMLASLVKTRLKRDVCCQVHLPILLFFSPRTSFCCYDTKSCDCFFKGGLLFLAIPESKKTYSVGYFFPPRTSFCCYDTKSCDCFFKGSLLFLAIPESKKTYSVGTADTYKEERRQRKVSGKSNSGSMNSSFNQSVNRAIFW